MIIKENLSRLRPYLTKNKIEAYRILHYGARCPAAVDIYKNNAVIHIFEKPQNAWLKELESELREHIGVHDFFYKNRTNRPSRSEAKPLSRPQGATIQNLVLPQAPHKEIIITEYGRKFNINLSDYLDTGLFLDHRETRRWIEAESKGKTVLNTFAYTGSFTVYAAAGGAALTHSVDLSKTYCEWIKKNLALNDLPPEKNWVFKMDTREYFSYARRKKLKFDIIIIDPPTFSRNKGVSFSVQKDYPLLINEASALLNPNGFILFSNNFKDFYMDMKKLPGLRVQGKTDLIPPDFRQPLTHTLPHKCFIIMCPKLSGTKTLQWARRDA